MTYHADLREEIGVMYVKGKNSNKSTLCLCIDGATADKLNYVKSDLLRVDVVKIIDECFKMIGKPVMSVNELLKEVDGNDKIWNLYANGFTMGLNQCERPASTEKCKRFKPQNVVELCAFIASIRPGFKSMGNIFWDRQPFKYGINALDELLKIPGMTGTSGESAFLIFDEQILKLLIAGGIPGPEAYATIKH